MDRHAHREYLDVVRRDLLQVRGKISELESSLSSERSRLLNLEKLETLVANLAGEPGDISHKVEYVAIDGPDKGVDAIDLAPQIANPVRHADVVEIVLREHGKPMKVAEIVQELIGRGHPLPEGSVKQFGAIYSAMLRRQHTFAQRDDGRWYLLSQGDSEPKPVDFDSLTQSEAAVMAIKSIGRPATMAEVIDRLEDLGYRHKTDRDHTYNSFYSSMMKSSKVKRVGHFGESLWDLADAPGGDTDSKQQFTLSGTIPKGGIRAREY